MNMIRWLFDTNIVIAHIIGEPALSFLPGQGAVSVLSVYEALRLPGLSSEEEKALQELFRVCVIIPATESIAVRAATLGRTRKTKSFDVLIAATALEIGADIITRNKKDFSRIPGLEVFEQIPVE